MTKEHARSLLRFCGVCGARTGNPINVWVTDDYRYNVVTGLICMCVKCYQEHKSR